MAMKRTRMIAYVRNPDDPDGEPLEHEVEIILGDQLRGELEAKKNMISLDLPIHTTVVWMWAALTRLGLYGGSFQEFRNVDCLGYDKPQGEAVDVDPTMPGPDGWPSNSPSPTPAPPPATG